MAFLCAPQPSRIELPVFYNVQGVVGAAPAQNLPEDVLFVQFAFETMGKRPVATSTPEFIEACKKVRVTGTIDKETIDAIRVFQTKHSTANAIVDGRVSPASSGYFYGPAGVYAIVAINDALQNRFIDIWPRIDKIPGCPAALSEMVIRTVAGK